jgi:D-glutamate cyclase
MPTTSPAPIDAIEAVIHRDVGRNIAPLFAAARGGLRGAVAALAELGTAAGGGTVGLITGFYVPAGSPPAAETDGPAGAALLAHALRRIGISCRLCTDSPCAAACRAALSGIADVPIDVVTLGGSVDEVIATWRAHDVRLTLAIERCGRTADGTARNMRGDDIGAYATLLDDLFLAGPWDTIAIGDGGNEIGMGALPRAVIGAHVAHGEAIACVTPATHLILAGVSHWGAYALIGGLAVTQPAWREVLLACLDPKLDRDILETTVRDGPAVDGVTRQRTLTIDSLDYATHQRVLEEIRMLVGESANHQADTGIN